jgi:hypothetical protein
MRKLRQLLLKDAFDGLWHCELSSACLELLDKLVLAITFHAKLLLDALELFHEVVFTLTLRDLAVYIARELGLELGIDQLFLKNEKSFPEAVFDDEGFQYVLELTNFTSGDGSSEVCKLVGLVEDIRRDLVDGEVGDLISEERIELSDVLENRDDFRHECANVLVVFVVGLREKVGNVHYRDVIILEEGGL